MKKDHLDPMSHPVDVLKALLGDLLDTETEAECRKICDEEVECGQSEQRYITPSAFTMSKPIKLIQGMRVQLSRRGKDFFRSRGCYGTVVEDEWTGSTDDPYVAGKRVVAVKRENDKDHTHYLADFWEPVDVRASRTFSPQLVINQP